LTRINIRRGNKLIEAITPPAAEILGQQSGLSRFLFLLKGFADFGIGFARQRESFFKLAAHLLKARIVNHMQPLTTLSFKVNYRGDFSIFSHSISPSTFAKVSIASDLYVNQQALARQISQILPLIDPLAPRPIAPTIRQVSLVALPALTCLSNMFMHRLGLSRRLHVTLGLYRILLSSEHRKIGYEHCRLAWPR
jgi:hypothetical protein